MTSYLNPRPGLGFHVPPARKRMTGAEAEGAYAGGKGCFTPAWVKTSHGILSAHTRLSAVTTADSYL